MSRLSRFRNPRPTSHYRERPKPTCGATTRAPDGVILVCDFPPHPEGSAHGAQHPLAFTYWGGPMPPGLEATVEILPRDVDAPPDDDAFPPPPDVETTGSVHRPRAGSAESAESAPRRPREAPVEPPPPPPAPTGRPRY